MRWGRLKGRGGEGGGERGSDFPISEIHPHGWRREGDVEEGMVEAVE